MFITDGRITVAPVRSGAIFEIAREGQQQTRRQPLKPRCYSLSHHPHQQLQLKEDGSRVLALPCDFACCGRFRLQRASSCTAPYPYINALVLELSTSLLLRKRAVKPAVSSAIFRLGCHSRRNTDKQQQNAKERANITASTVRGYAMAQERSRAIQVCTVTAWVNHVIEGRNAHTRQRCIMYVT